MNPTTLELLRNAAIEALQNKNDESAAELLSLMELPMQPTLPAATAPPLVTVEATPIQFPALPESNEGRDYHFWMKAIRDCYLPTLEQEGQTEFTTPQLFSWVDFVGFPLTTGDMQMVGNRPYWKCRAGTALGHLCNSNVIHRYGFFSKTYSTVRPSPVLSSAD